MEKTKRASEIVEDEIKNLAKMLPNLANSTDKAALLTVIELHALNRNMNRLIDAVKDVGRSIR